MDIAPISRTYGGKAYPQNLSALSIKVSSLKFIVSDYVSKMKNDNFMEDEFKRDVLIPLGEELKMIGLPMNFGSKYDIDVFDSFNEALGKLTQS